MGLQNGSVITNEGTSVSSKGSAAKGDVFRIERTGGNTIKFYKNGTFVSNAATTNSSAMLVDASFRYSGSIFANVRASFAKSGDSIVRRFEYDHAGRLVKAWHKYNTQAEVLLSANEYNELGQLIDKKLHSVDNGVTGKQSIDHRYNIRGWLTSINGSDLDASNINIEASGQQRDLFGMNLFYNNVETGLGNSSLYNGNISAMKWSNNWCRGCEAQCV